MDLITVSETVVEQKLNLLLRQILRPYSASPGSKRRWTDLPQDVGAGEMERN